MSERRYDEKEVGKILQKAAEYQSGLAQAGNTEGLTLEELQKVAGEVGIDPAIVERAAGEVDLSPESRSRNKSDSILIERTVDGELSDETWGELVTELRRFVGKPGTTEITGKMREWMGGWDVGSVMLSATSRGGKTRLKLMGDYSGATALVYTLGISVGFLVTLFTVVAVSKSVPGIGPLPTTLLAASIAGLTTAACTWIFRSFKKRFAGRMEDLLETLARVSQTTSLQGEEPDLREALSKPVSETVMTESGSVEFPQSQSSGQ